MASHPIYQFYAELDELEPKIWRRFQVSDDVTVARLGYIIQVLYEMTASHLMAIEVPQSENFRNYIRINHPDDLHKHMLYDLKDEVTMRYEIFDEDFEPFSDPHRIVRTEDATQTRIRRAVYLPNDKLNFNYDFGDDWWVSLTLEKVFEDKELDGRELPRVRALALLRIAAVSAVWRPWQRRSKRKKVRNTSNSALGSALPISI